MDKALLTTARRIAKTTSWMVRLTIPSILAQGEKFALKIAVLGPDFMPNGDFRHRLIFEGSTGVLNLPTCLDIPPDSDGLLEIPGLEAATGEVAFVRARVENTGAMKDPVLYSNPAWVSKYPDDRIFWGDLHIHTIYSNCSPHRCKDPEFGYQYAMEASHLNFAAHADHLRGIMSDPDRWPRLQELARRYNQPGRFVAFLAFESSHAKGFGGDNNAYFLRDTAPCFWSDREDMRGVAPRVHLKELWDFLDDSGHEYLTIPHHTGRRAKNRIAAEDYHDPKREPLFEIYSSWGSSETMNSRFPVNGGNSLEPAYYVDFLRAGYRYGIMASSDDHETLPGSDSRFRGDSLGFKAQDGYNQRGLVALRAPALDRASLWQALKQRNCYATTSQRTLIDCRIGDAGMGRELKIGRQDPLRKKREIRLDLTAVTPETQLQATIMRNGVEMECRQVPGKNQNARKNRLVFIDETPLEQACIRDARFHPEPFTVYYARIASPAGFTQWTSPIWLDLE